MERKTSLDEAKKIMGKNFIGPEELTKIENTMGIIVPKSFPEIQFTEIELKEKNADHILILGVSLMKNGEPVTILSLRKKFGINPETSEPCFYNQDWYIKENFANIRLASTWYLIKKNIKESLRGIDPSSKFANLKSNFFIPAILGAYTFFAWYILKNEVLWKNEYIWCNDFDSNSDRIYLGKYIDEKGINKNGLEIHRHLSIKNNYSFISYT